MIARYAKGLLVVLALGYLGLMAGYTYLANRFGPGFSSQDRAYFQQTPCVVERAGAYSLQWQYGQMGFTFLPRSKAVNGELLFCLTATASSGRHSGEMDERVITDAAEIQALKTGGAFWLEPGGGKTRLEVRRG